MKYKLLVLDLDGTLTNSKKQITPFTQATLMEAQELGLQVVLASGRPTYGIVAVGDGNNDVSMIRYAGLGVAMANAQEPVKASANYVTPQTNDEDGVAWLVKKLLKEENEYRF